MSDIKDFEPLWGVWRTEALLGKGSYGKVYRAVREEYGRRYYAAVKHISVPASDAEIDAAIAKGLASDRASAMAYYEDIAQKTIDEIDLMNNVKGITNIVSYEDHSIVRKPSGIGYDIIIRMELLTDLNNVLRHRQFTDRDVVKLGIDLCSALEVCAEQGIIHRDIKASNIFVSDTGNYKLGDFGIACKPDQCSVPMKIEGTPGYVPPEIYRGEPVGFSVDLYALGIVMYRILNGNRAPFLPVSAAITKEDKQAALNRQKAGEPLPAPAFANEALARIILKATHPDRRCRYFSPTEMKNDLLRLSDLPDIERTVPIIAEPGRGSAPSSYNVPSAPATVPPQAPVHTKSPVPAAALLVLLAAGLVIGFAAVRGLSAGKADTGDSASSTGFSLPFVSDIFSSDEGDTDSSSHPAGNVAGASGVCRVGNDIYYVYNGLCSITADSHVSKRELDGDARLLTEKDGVLYGIFNNRVQKYTPSSARFTTLFAPKNENQTIVSYCFGDGCLYVVTLETKNNGVFDYECHSFYRAGLDGTDGSYLYEIPNEQFENRYMISRRNNGNTVANLFYANDRLYFLASNHSDFINRLCSVNTGGTDFREDFAFTGDLSDSMMFSDGRVYIASAQDGFFSCLPDGSDKTVIRSDEVEGFKVMGDVIVYVEKTKVKRDVGYFSYGKGLHCINGSAGDRQIFDDYCKLVGVCGNWIYFYDNGTDPDHLQRQLSRVRLNGTGLMKMPEV